VASFLIEASNSLEIYSEAETMLRRFVLLVKWLGSWCLFGKAGGVGKETLVATNSLEIQW
jgi:hypothetical protein